jgi:hypothetical protein
MGKKCNSTKSQFPSIVELFESESNVEECNLFPKITMNIMQQRDWFKIWDQLKEGKLQFDKKMLKESYILF